MGFDIRETARERVVICAHRGIFGGNIPCNTIAAFDFAIAEGADMIELDVTKSADGELFIFHPGMERRQFCMDVNIQKMTAEEARRLRLCNVDGAKTEHGLNTLDETLEHLRGRCYINVDKFWDAPTEIIGCIRRHGMKDQIVFKCPPRKRELDIIESLAPDIQYMPLVTKDDGVDDLMKTLNVNYIGCELLFASEDDDTASYGLRERLHREGRLCFVNAEVYDYRAVLTAGHTDDAAVMGDPEFGWGWLADRFDILQTDWPGRMRRFLEDTGRRYRKGTLAVK